ncbi:hypothetical protein [uncultured Mitsuokella sp.]|uniref:hypothetical protein n=1 Tax=uncultured Mitsuokella sp. TaxID=453120 RepID=UPI0026049902|nr:hypothetical protein [uncultured Mitsuokella sp.]
MTLDEWIALYDRKNPQDPFRPSKGFSLQFREDKGFCEVAFTKHSVIIGSLAGDARFFKERIEEAARKVGIHRGGTICTRPAIRAYIRLFGGKIVHVEALPDGKKRYRCRTKEGKAARISPAWTYDATGKDAYFVTWEF